MRALIAVLALALLALLLAEFFSTFLLPRRVKRDPRIARGILRTVWRPWRALADKLPPRAADTALGIYGPLGLLLILAVLALGVIISYAALYWAASVHLGSPHARSAFGDYLYFSGGAFFSASTPSEPVRAIGKAMQIGEAAIGLSFLGIIIGYLPALFQAFSRRETAVARLDPRAGTPPTAAALLERSGLRGGWHELDEYLREWETWTAELMETHLSYPILGYFRSQHVGQNWLAALTTVVDACAYAIAYGPDEAIEAAEITFRIGRHALADLAFVFNPRRVGRDTGSDGHERLAACDLLELRRRLEDSNLHSEARPRAVTDLEELRRSYEPYAIAIARQLRLGLPDWLPGENVTEYWRISPSRANWTSS